MNNNKRTRRRRRNFRKNSQRVSLNRFISDTSISGLSQRPVYTLTGKVGGYLVATNGSGGLTSNSISVTSMDFFRPNGGSGGTYGALSEQMGVFTEWRPIKITAHLRPLTDSPGVTFFTWTPNNYYSNPQLVPSSRSLCVNNSYKMSQRRSLLWVPSDLNDLDFNDVGATGLSIINFWMYTDNSTYSSPVSTSLFLIEFECVVQVRGQATQ
jgi:hypothetical protein